MPCFRCGRLQTDPRKGSLPWARGVVGREQVLVCPDCQRDDPHWSDRFRRCASCEGTRLSIVLGAVVCRQCGEQSE